MADNPVTHGTLELPMEALRELAAGFSLDIGGSVCKVIYRDKDDWEELQKTKPEPKMGKLRLTYFRSEDSAQALQLLKEKCYIHRTADTPTPTVYTTGFGSNKAGNEIQELLDVKLDNRSEYDCFIDGFIYLTQNLSPKDFVIPLNEEVLQKTYRLVKDKIEGFVHLAGPGKLEHTHTDTEKGPRYSLPRPVPEKFELPALLAMCGSGVAVMKVQGNGVFALIDGSNNGGRTFLGLGSLLTGAKTYDEIIDLASKGDNSNVDLFPKDLDGTDCESSYTKALAAQGHGDIIQSFQKAKNKKPEEFKREDLALSLLHMTTQQLAQMVLYCSIRTKCPHAFFCGSFFNRELVRDVMTESLTKRMIFVDSLQNGLKVDMGFHFIKNGSHLGAIGALVCPLKHKSAAEKSDN